MKNKYIIFHPGTGTFMDAEDSYLVPIADLPEDQEVWEEWLRSHEYNPDDCDIREVAPGDAL